MSTPNQVYVSNQVPFGGFFINLYRGQSSPTLLGVYRVEQCNPTPAAVEGQRPDIDGGDNGWWLCNGIIQGPITLQVATSLTPTPANGDFFKTSVIFRDSSGTAVTQILVLKSPAPDVSTNTYRKFTGQVQVDQFPDATVSAITEYSA